MFVVHRSNVLIQEDFGPIDCTTREGIATEFNRRDHKTESNCFVVTDSSMGNHFAVVYSLVEGL